QAKLKVVEVPPGPPVLAPIVAEIYAPDQQSQQQVAALLEAKFKQQAGMVDIDSSVVAQAIQKRLLVDQNKAMMLGVNSQTITQTLQLALTGQQSSVLFANDAKYAVPMRVSLADNDKSQLANILKLQVKADDGSLIPLSELVNISEEPTEQAIYHKDLLPVSYVFADFAGKLDSPLYGLFAMRDGLAQLNLPYSAKLTEYFIRQPDDALREFAIKWDGEWQITYETFRDMGIAYAVGLVLIYLLVVAQFHSYAIPAVIMMPIPLTIIGVMPSHALLGAQFTATSMIGMIALAGIIVRNSILLVDFIQLKLAEGMALDEAVIQAASTRAKPIMLTGLAAMLGALFILDDPIFNGLAISLISGILVSTFLTLVLIPLLYFGLQRRVKK
ncbi:MAG TPA: efflux RND transporter permease subunit, partial [Agitococcus sp.]|nr:efflux RND transporter permease subunit [Agitococcus sp.]